MKNFIKDHRFIAGLLSIFISVFLVSIVAYGATTIGTNLETGIASTTESVRIGGDVGDDDDILYFDASEENLTWDDSPGLFTLTDSLQMTGSVSSTEYMSIGGNAGDDDDILYFDTREENLTWDDSSGLFTLTDDLDITGYVTSTVGVYSQGVLEIGGNGLIRGAATTTGSHYIGGTASTTELFVSGAAHVGGDLSVDGNLTTVGYASSTGDINTQANMHVGGNFDVDGTLNIGEGSNITKFMFGYCNIATTTIAVDTSAYIECTGATDVRSNDRVFVTATSSLSEHFVIQAASSTIDNIIHIRIWNSKDASDTGTGDISFNWMAIR